MAENKGRQIEKLSASVRAMTHANLINSDNFRTYGTFAEIGAGLETSRHFFQAGKAASTIAKAMSAYAKEASDVVYLEDYLETLKPQVQKNGDGTRSIIRPESAIPYTSRFRVLKMLRYEYDLLVTRFANEAFAATIEEDRRQQGDMSKDFPAFFVYANSVSVSNWGRDADRCHGWVGARVQIRQPAKKELAYDSSKTGPYADILAHVVMLEEFREEQMETLGIFGVHLLHAAIDFAEGTIIHREDLLKAITGNIEYARMRIDVIDVSTGTFPDMKAEYDELYRSPKLAFDMVDHRLTHSTLLAKSTNPELAGVRGSVVEKIKEKGEIDLIFPANHQRVAQRYFSRSDVFVHKTPLTRDGKLDVASMHGILQDNWLLPGETINKPKHVFVCSLEYFKERPQVKYYEIARQFLDSCAGPSEYCSLLLVRFNDPGWLIEHVCRLTYDGGFVHFAISAHDFGELLKSSVKSWRERDEWITKYTESDERSGATIRRNRARGLRIWSDSSKDFLLRVIQRPEDRNGKPTCDIRVRGWQIGKDDSGLDSKLAGLLDFMKASGKLAFVA